MREVEVVDELVSRVFRTEVARQCRFTLLASGDLARALNGQGTDRIWYSVQSLLASATNLSKLLWPPDAARSERGLQLRLALQLTGDSPPMLRALRDHLDQPDERLEDWVAALGDRGVIDSEVAPVTAKEGIDPTRYLRHFDPQTWWLNLRGESYDLRLLIEEVDMLLLRVRALGWD